MSKIVVYTAIAGKYDTLKEPPGKLLQEVDFVAFCDFTPKTTAWQIRKPCTEFTDPCRNAKTHKVLPHVFFPEATYSLWIDGSVKINRAFPIRQWIDKYLSEHDWAVFKHPERQCIFEEAEACIRSAKDDPAIIRSQMARYRHEHYPANNGLVESTIILRRHTEAVRRLNEAWFQEIKNNSRRDQLSFNYVAHKASFQYAHLPESLRRGPGRSFHVQSHAATIGHELRVRKAQANRLLLIFIILALAWIPAGLLLILADPHLRPVLSRFVCLWPCPVVPLCGAGIFWIWRLWLKRQIREKKWEF
jgi:hypothetical protein